jgi:hypothetical protein
LSAERAPMLGDGAMKCALLLCVAVGRRHVHERWVAGVSAAFGSNACESGNSHNDLRRSVLQRLGQASSVENTRQFAVLARGPATPACQDDSGPGPRACHFVRLSTAK